MFLTKLGKRQFETAKTSVISIRQVLTTAMVFSSVSGHIALVQIYVV